MRDPVEIGHGIKCNAVRLNSDLVMDFETCFKIHANVCSFDSCHKPDKKFKSLSNSYNFLSINKENPIR